MSADMSQYGLHAAGAGRDPYEMWDASYVLGSLSSSERREFEEHLDECLRCRTAVAELSGMPALLALLDHDDDADDGQPRPGDPPPLRPEVFDALLARVNAQRRRFRRVTWVLAAAAAAVVLALGAIAAVQSTLPSGGADRTAPPAAVAYSMAQVTPSSVTATVSLTPHAWGTAIGMSCTYGPEEAADHDGGGDRLAMVAVGRDGSHVQLATWLALDGVTAEPSGATSMPVDAIAAVQVVAADTGDVLLQKSL
jgi:hypothetical protein